MLPALPLGLTFGQPGAGVGRQLIAELGQGLAQASSALIGNTLQLLQTHLALLNLLLALLQLQVIERLLLFQLAAQLLQT